MTNVEIYEYRLDSISRIPGTYEVVVHGSRELHLDVVGIGTMILLKESGAVDTTRMERFEAEASTQALVELDGWCKDTKSLTTCDITTVWYTTNGPIDFFRAIHVIRDYKLDNVRYTRNYELLA